MHARRYQYPPAQKQVMRILLMPAIYAIVSFFSYRYYREYEYYYLAQTAYEAITLSAFLILLAKLVLMRTGGEKIGLFLRDKKKRRLPFPFLCWRFNPSKPYVWHALIFSVMQFVVLRPLISIAGMICEYCRVLCPGVFSPHYATVYLEAINFVSISIALYGLIVFYVLCKENLNGMKPLNKFLAIKLIVFFAVYQNFLFSALKTHGVIKGTALWTAANVASGLSALCTTGEMVIFSIYMSWAYSWTDYTDLKRNTKRGEINFKPYRQAIWDTINILDFVGETHRAFKFFAKSPEEKKAEKTNSEQSNNAEVGEEQDDTNSKEVIPEPQYVAKQSPHT
nr:hypothetical protein L203_00437 [Cryptococcus depauperatus CBS 7841]